MDNEAERRSQATIDEMMTGLLEATRDLAQQGFVQPFHIVMLGVNGSLASFRFEPDEEGDEAMTIRLVSYDEGPGFAFPVNVMLVDAVGEAARMLIRASDVKPEVVH